MTDIEAPPKGLVTERDFLKTLLDLAKLKGWLCYHVFEQYSYARRTSVGFPDLVLAKGGRLIFAEVKSEYGKLTEAQSEWLEALKGAGAEVHVWMPSDWEEVLSILT